MNETPRRTLWIRIALTVVFVLIAAIPIAWYSVTAGTRNAPITIGGGDDAVIIDEPTLESSDDGSIPQGNPPRDLLLITDQGGDWDIALLEADGTLTNLTQDGSDTHDLMGTWSFDSDTINFLSNRGDPEQLGPTQIKASDPTSLRPLTVVSGVITMFRESQFDWDPAWSPDGSAMVWVSVRDLNLELYQIATDVEFTVQNAVRLTESGSREWYAAWSPDGTQLLFNNDSDGNENIYLYDLASGDQTQLTTHEKDDIRGLWSLDGTQIAFASERDGDFITDGMQLYVMNADGSDQRILADGEIFEGGAVTLQGGSHVAYLSNREGNWQIYVMQADGSNLRRVTDGEANYLLPSWRP